MSSKSNDEPNRLVRADAVELAATLDTGTLDLVYLDPPFGVGKSRSVLKGRENRFGLGDAVAYEDPTGKKAGDVTDWQKCLYVEAHRTLRDGGAFFLHLDWRTVHRAKLLLDSLFGAENFLNEIIWRYATGGVPKSAFARKHDTILFYVKRTQGTKTAHTFHRLQEKKYLAHKMSRKGVPEYRDERGWYRFRYLDDVWEIPWLTQDSKERTGYPTQKPIALLKRILEAATNPGDLVADFCCGSGTTAVAAEMVGRRWIAGDRSELAIEVTKGRLEAMHQELFPKGEFVLEDRIDRKGETTEELTEI